VPPSLACRPRPIRSGPRWRWALRRGSWDPGASVAGAWVGGGRRTCPQAAATMPRWRRPQAADISPCRVVLLFACSTGYPRGSMALLSTHPRPRDRRGSAERGRAQMVYRRGRQGHRAGRVLLHVHLFIEMACSTSGPSPSGEAVLRDPEERSATPALIAARRPSRRRPRSPGRRADVRHRRRVRVADVLGPGISLDGLHVLRAASISSTRPLAAPESGRSPRP